MAAQIVTGRTFALASASASSVAATSSDCVRVGTFFLFDRSLTALSIALSVHRMASRYHSVSEYPKGFSDSVTELPHGRAVDAGATPRTHACSAAGRRRGGVRRKRFHASESR